MEKLKLRNVAISDNIHKDIIEFSEYSGIKIRSITESALRDYLQKNFAKNSSRRTNKE